MDIKLIDDEIKAKKEIISKAQAYIRKAEQEIAEYLCPFKVGDKVLSAQGELEIVASIAPRRFGTRYEFKIYKIKKSGEPYKISQHVYPQEGYKLAQLEESGDE
jgi:hypothetical protein